MTPQSPPRIAQVMLAKGFGGAERSFVDLSAALASRGYPIMAVCAHRGEALRRLADNADVLCRPVTITGTWDPLAAWSIRRALRAFGAQIVQAHLARAARLAGRAARGLRLPTVAKTHNYVNVKYYRDIDQLVPTTRGQYDFLLSQGVPVERLRHIVNFSSVAPVTAVAHSVKEPFVVCSLGRFVRKKGFDVLLRAFGAMANGGVAARLVIAGAGPEERAIREQAAALGSAAIEFPGWVDEPRQVMQGADLFVLPSREEPFGIVLLEAMALGVPIVATRTAGPLEVLDDDTALLVQPDDWGALTVAMREALLNRPAARARATAALALFNARYSEAAVVPSYEALYRDLLDHT